MSVVGKKILRDSLGVCRLDATLKKKSAIAAIAKINGKINGKRCQSTAAVEIVEPILNDIPQKTGLYDLHLDKGGRMVNFCGYYLPVQYDDMSITASHLHTRSHCSIFDVSHMLQTNVYGRDAVEFLESVCVTDIAGMNQSQSALSLFINDKTGGIIDDFIVTKISDKKLYLVSNASRQITDKRLLLDALEKFQSDGSSRTRKDVTVEFLDSTERSLIAIQGPKTADILQKRVNVDLKRLPFMNTITDEICGIEDCRITRCGYTGEDGFEISVPTDRAIDIVQLLLNDPSVRMAGLGARDTLRLEAGLCLYGNDIDENTTPVEAGLTWIISKRRRETQRYPASNVIAKQIRDGVQRKRVGIMKIGGPPARSGTVIIGFDDEIIGRVTSGSPSPSLGVNIAMGYVDTSYAKTKTDIRLKIRETLFNASVVKMPFSPANYYHLKK